ncbi:MFS transporter [bacterium]|nr:MAG: MFS transporter [bacterium]
MRHRPAALIFILITVLIDVIGIGLIIPVLPELMRGITGSEAAAAQGAGWIAAVYSTMQFLCAPVVGALSDRFGRRPILLAAIFGTGFDYVLLYFAPNLAWLIIGRVIVGILGASFTVANSYIADVSAPEDRAKNFGYIGAMFGLGFILGPLIGGVLGERDVHLPFAFAAGLSLLNGLYGYFVLPESLAPEKRRASFGWADLNPFRAVAQAWKYPVFRMMTTTLVLVFLGQQSIFHTWNFFAQKTLGWDPKHSGFALAYLGVVTAIVQGGLIGFFVKRLGERTTISIGLVLSSIELILFGLVRQDWQMYAVITLGSLAGIAGPTIQGFISRQVDESEQGVIQGSILGLQSFVSAIGPVLMTAVYAYFNRESTPVHIPGAAFFLGGVFAVIATAVTIPLLRRFPDPPPAEGPAKPAEEGDFAEYPRPD